MKKLVITGKHIKLMINLLCLCIFAISYLYIFPELGSSAESARKEAEAVREEIQERKRRLNEEEQLKDDIIEFKDEMQSILERYPVLHNKEDNLLFTQELYDSQNIMISSLNISDSTVMYETILPSRINVTGIIPETGYITGIITILNLNFTTSYSGLKDIAEFIKNYPERTSIESASISYDSTNGQLTGNMILKRYALIGNGKDYQYPDIRNIDLGVPNVFGTLPDMSLQPEY